MKLFAHSQTSTMWQLKIGNGYVILSHTLLVMWLFINVNVNVLVNGAQIDGAAVALYVSKICQEMVSCQQISNERDIMIS